MCAQICIHNVYVCTYQCIHICMCEVKPNTMHKHRTFTQFRATNGALLLTALSLSKNFSLH